jgi:hypothetical protein
VSRIVFTVDVGRPHRAVAPTVDGDVLVALAGTTRPLTGREVTRLTPRGSQTAVAKALDRLVSQGIVLREQAGRAYLHVLNRNHLAAPAVTVLATMRTELLERVRGALRDWRVAPVHASLFGSAARGDGDADSDIDLLIVRSADVGDEDPIWRTQIETLVDAVHAWTGNSAAIVELAEDEFQDLAERRPAIVADLRDDGIDLAGVPIRTALTATAR